MRVPRETSGGIATLRAQALAAAKRIFDEMLNVESDVTEKPNPITIAQIGGHLRFENVSFRYSTTDAPEVLENISFRGRPGEVVAPGGEADREKARLST